MEIYESNHKYLHFLTPALVSFGSGVLLLVFQVIVSIPLIGVMYNLPEFRDPLYEPVWNLIILFAGQIAGTIFILFWLIPWLRVKDVEHRPLSRYASGSTLLIICMTWSLIVINTIIQVISTELFRLETPRSGLETLLLPEEIFSPLTFIILFAPFVVGAPLFEELVYRRILIPLLERGGLSPFGAVLVSSVFFTLLHAPINIIYGNTTGSILHLSTILILAFILGFIYIKTRNVIYPIIIHGVVNGISVVPTILIEGTEVAMAYEVFYLIITVVIGLIYLIYLLLKYSKKARVIINQITTGEISINSKGVYGYFLISLGLLFLHTLSSIFLLELSTLLISPVILIVIWYLIKNDSSQKDQLMKDTTEYSKQKKCTDLR